MRALAISDWISWIFFWIYDEKTAKVSQSDSCKSYLIPNYFNKLWISIKTPCCLFSNVHRWVSRRLKKKIAAQYTSKTSSENSLISNNHIPLLASPETNKKNQLFLPRSRQKLLPNGFFICYYWNSLFKMQ